MSTWEIRFLHLEKQHQARIQENQQLKSECNSLQSQIGPLKRHQEVTKGILEKEARNARQAQDERSSLAEELLKVRDQLMHEEQLKQEQIGENAQLRRDVKHWQSEASTYLGLIRELEVVNEDNTAAMAEIERLRKEISSQNAALTSVRGDLDKGREKLVGEKARHRETKDELDARSNELVRMTAHWTSAKEQNAQILRELEDISHQAKHYSEHYERELGHKSAQVNEVGAELDLAKHQIQVLESKVKLQQDHSAKVEAECRRLEEVEASLSASVRSLGGEKKNYEHQFMDINHHNEALIEKLRAMQVQVSLQREEADKGRARHDELVGKMAILQQQLVQVQKSFLHRIEQEEAMRKDTRARDRDELAMNLEREYQDQTCRRCAQTYQERGNSSESCVVHSGRYVDRGLPFSGRHWTCCQQTKAEASPCTVVGPHTTTKARTTSVSGSSRSSRSRN